MGLADGIIKGAGASTGGSSAVKGATASGSALGGYTEVVSAVAGMIVNYAFASSIKKDQKKFEKEIANLSEQKQKELLQKVQQTQDELERQKIVYQYVSKARIDELKKETKKEQLYLYGGLALGLIVYALLIFKLKKR